MGCQHPLHCSLCVHSTISKPLGQKEVQRPSPRTEPRAAGPRHLHAFCWSLSKEGHQRCAETPATLSDRHKPRQLLLAFRVPADANSSAMAPTQAVGANPAAAAAVQCCAKPCPGSVPAISTAVQTLLHSKVGGVCLVFFALLEIWINWQHQSSASRSEENKLSASGACFSPSAIH